MLGCWKKKGFPLKINWLCPQRCSEVPRRHRRVQQDSLSPCWRGWRSSSALALFLALFCSPVPAKLTPEKTTGFFPARRAGLWEKAGAWFPLTPDRDDSVCQEPSPLPRKREKQSYRARSLTHAFYQGAADPLAYSLVFPRGVQRLPVVARRGGKNSGRFLEPRMCSQRGLKSVYLCILNKTSYAELIDICKRCYCSIFLQHWMTIIFNFQVLL